MAQEKKQIGVCYYPEHWPEEVWQSDAERMVEIGISVVRIGEFAWSKLEPKRGDYQFDWLKKSIDILHKAGLSIVLGTPTATPPKWLVDEMPDMLPVRKDGSIGQFGSRRHYSFSHLGYRAECARIVTKLGEAFGNHPGITAWQTDNEYDCHDTTLSFSPIDLNAFQEWLSQKYQSPEALNKAWGNIFWSMEVSNFNQIELPNQTVTEANPSHWMDYRRFASDQVVKFNCLQCEIIRKLSPGRDIIHNFMGRTLAFDHFDVGSDLDISSWDSYPLGFLEDRSDRSETFKMKFSRSGDPDFQAFHHDVYRATSNGRWWVMEQQPGAVNWAPHNPAPQAGMVRLWALEAFAHGAETVSYFRWRQAPFAQEQMHSGLLRSNHQEAEGFHEASQVCEDLAKIEWPKQHQAEVAIILDYPSSWAWEIQPQGKEFNYFRLVFDFYKALRSLGLTIDIIPSSKADLSQYKMVVVPGLFTFSESLCKVLENCKGVTLIGPRSGSKTENFAIPISLPPSLSKSILDIEVLSAESLRPDCPVECTTGSFKIWREFVETGPDATCVLETLDGHPALIAQNNHHYLCGWPDEPMLKVIFARLCKTAKLETLNLPDEIRLTHADGKYFVTNYGSQTADLSKLVKGKAIFGSVLIEPSGFTIIERAAS
ncbi:MAG: beta-galactosidase [Salaquimonas sp.]